MESLAEQSRIWIYQADRELSPEESDKIATILESFCKDWTAHNNSLKAGYRIAYKRFLILIVDESRNDASGCSIDKSVHAIRNIGTEYGINFFGRTEMGYLMENKLRTLPFHEISQAVKKGTINDKTLFFDTRIATLGELDRNFLKPLGEHWLAGFTESPSER